jgi:hypothetical protein
MSVRPLQVRVAAASTVVAALAAWWLSDPAHDPYGYTHTVGVGVQLPDGVAASVVGVAALVGAVGAVLLRPGPWLTLLAGTEVLLLGLLAPDLQLLTVLGYLAALALPAGALAALVVAARRDRRIGALAAVLVVAGTAWGLSTGALDRDALVRLVDGLGSGFAALGLRPWMVVAVGATGLLWGLLLVRTHDTRRLQDLLRRHGTAITVVAALGPAPYALARMTWFTPWQLHGPGAELEASPEVRLWGILLGAAALVGVVLTLGLVSRWGERFPGWVPWLAARPVPVAAAVVPASLVAAVVTMAAPSVVAQAIERGDASVLLVFPLPVWGPALALATLAYVLRRRDAARATLEPQGVGAAG